MSKEHERKAQAELDQRLRTRDLKSQWEREAHDRVRHATQTILAETNDALRVSLMVFWAKKLVEEHGRCGFPYDDPLHVITYLEASLSLASRKTSEHA